MDTTLTTWFSCNEETQCYDTNNNNCNNSSNNAHNESNNMYNGHSNNNDNSNSTNYANTTDAQVTFNQRQPNELRQTRLQRQHEQLHHSPSSSLTSTPTQLVQSPDTLSATQTPVAQSAQHASVEKSRSPSLAQRLTRRKRLQRQKPTELDDADFAYAADLEEEDEEEEAVLKQQQQASNMFNVTPLMETMCAAELPATTFAEKRLNHFQQQHHSTPFDGQPSSLPNCFATAGSISTFHHQHQHQHHQHQLQHQQHHHHHHQMHQHHIRERRLKHEESFDSSTTTTTNTTDTPASPASPLLRRHHFAMLKRDNSTHSESSSRYSSVDSLLEARKPDPEAILINLGFGPVGSEDILSRIPKRFLKPSQVRGIDTEAFVRRLQLASNLADHSVLGYRGLTGNPDIPPSRIVAKIMQRFEVNERKKSMGSIEHTI